MVKLVLTCLAMDPSAWPTAADLLNHDWFKEFDNLETSQQGVGLDGNPLEI